MSWEYGEQHLVQEPAAAWMAAHGWKSVLAFNEEDFGPESLLGREDKSQTILLRSVRRALAALNAPWITPEQIDEAIAKITAVEHGKTLLQQNCEMSEFLREGVRRDGLHLSPRHPAGPVRPREAQTMNPIVLIPLSLRADATRRRRPHGGENLGLKRGTDPHPVMQENRQKTSLARDNRPGQPL